MTRHVACPSCKTSVDVAEGLSSATCPRCLAQIVVSIAAPANAPAAQPPPLPASASIPAPARPGARTCPSCGQPVAESWRYCPHCASWAAGRPAHSRAAVLQVDVQVSRDSRRVGKGLVVLSVLGALGLLQAGMGAIGAAVNAGDPTAILILLGVVVFLLVCSTAVAFWRSTSDPTALGIGRILIGALRIAGVLFAASVVLGLAFLVFLFIVCSNGFR